MRPIRATLPALALATLLAGASARAQSPADSAYIRPGSGSRFSEQDSVPGIFARFASAGLTDAPARPRFPMGLRGVTLPLGVEAHQLFLAVRVNGSEPLRFLLDTGSPHSLISRDAAERLRLPDGGAVALTGFSEEQDTSRVRLADSLRLGQLWLGPLRFTEFGLRRLSRMSPHPVDGVLGWDALGALSVRLDLLRGTLTLADTSAAVPPAGAFALPFEPRIPVPAIRATYDSKHEGTFILGTGAALYFLGGGPFVDAGRLWRGGSWDQRVGILGLIGQKPAFILRQRPLRMARLVQDCPWVAIFHSEEGDSLEFLGADGLIGEAALEPLEITLDGPRREAYLWPAIEADPPDRLGWGVEWTEERLEVTSILPGQAAEAAGLRKGDVLARLNGMDLDGLRPATLRRLTDLPTGSVVRLTVLRREGSRDLDVLISDPR